MLKNALLLIGSPKHKNSASEVLGTYLLTKLEAKGMATHTLHLQSILKKGEEAVLTDAVARTDLVILAFPLYVDTLPYYTIKALEVIAESYKLCSGEKRPKLLVIANCGYPEAEHNDNALAICRRFASETGLEWVGGLKLGMGFQVLQGGKALQRVTPALEHALFDLLSSRPVSEKVVKLLAKPTVPKWLYVLTGNFGWRQAAKKFKAKDLSAKPYQQ